MRIPLRRKPRSRRPRSQVCRVDSEGWGSCWAERTGHTTPPPAPKPSQKSPLAFPAASPCTWPPRWGPWVPGSSDPHRWSPTPRGLAGALAAAQEGGRASHFLWFPGRRRPEGCEALGRSIAPGAGTSSRTWGPGRLALPLSGTRAVASAAPRAGRAGPGAKRGRPRGPPA